MRQTLDQPLDTLRGQLSVRLPFRPGAKIVSDPVTTGEGTGICPAVGVAETVGLGDGDSVGVGLGDGVTVGDGDAVSTRTSGTETCNPPDPNSRLVLYGLNPPASTEIAYLPGFKSVN